jgi:hypothetical protein
VTSACTGRDGQHLSIILDAGPDTSASGKLQPYKPAAKSYHQKKNRRQPRRGRMKAQQT